jgi:hypothetical protein
MNEITPGTESDKLPDVLATGRADVAVVYLSMSKRHPEGRDADFIAWHSLDHRPEQHRLAQLRTSLRLVSTPACRAARAASDPRYDATDHIMTYMFSDAAGLKPFSDLGQSLGRGGRMPYLLPAVERGAYRLQGIAAAPRIKVGADVLPWWPAKGVYVLIERGEAPAADLIDVPGVGGAWWGTGIPGAQGSGGAPNTGLQFTYCFLDGDPAETAAQLRPALQQRWASRGVSALLAAPFHVLDPWQRDRYLP